MNLMDKLPAKAVSKLAPMAAKLEIAKPDILMAGGLVAVTGATVFAGWGTLKAKTVLEKRANDMDAIKQAKDLEEYSAEDEKTDLVKSNVQLVGGMAKAYSPAAACLILGVVMLVSARNIRQSRLVAVTASYNALLAIFNQYRERVREDAGEEKDRLYLHGGEEVEVEETETTKSGKEKKVKKTVLQVRPKEEFYIRLFDRRSPEWSNPNHNPGYNLSWLEGQERTLTDQLHARRFVLLSDVLDQLGLPLVPEDATDDEMALYQSMLTHGWHMDAPNNDGYIRFNIHKAENLDRRDWVETAEDSYWLEFNCDGDIAPYISRGFRR